MTETIEKKINKNNKKRVIISVIVLFILCCLFAFGIYYFQKDSKQNFNPVAVFTGKDPGYNFEELRKTFPDIIAWIKVPGTSIDTPIVQSPDDDFYYLTHNAQKNYDAAGAAYIEMKNNKELSDPVTLIYGHNMLDQRIFSEQLKFADSNFFNENRQIIIYLPGKKYTYEICSAYVYDNRHIMNSYNFKDKEVLKTYFQQIMNPDSLSKNIKEGIVLTENDKIIQLSTCMNDLSLKNQRYLLNGVLRSEENVG